MLTAQEHSDYRLSSRSTPETTIKDTVQQQATSGGDDEDPIMLARVLLQLLDGQIESNLFESIRGLREKTNLKREAVQQDAQQMLKDLSRSVEQSKALAAKSTREEDAILHVKTMESLSLENSTCASEISQLQSKVNSYEDRLTRLRQEIMTLEEEERQEAAEPLHHNTVTLAIYQSLGITFLDKDPETGKYKKCIVRKVRIVRYSERSLQSNSNSYRPSFFNVGSRESNNVEELELDSNFSNYFYANYLWDASK